jgi:1,4-alpha-glucan branching enzyme
MNAKRTKKSAPAPKPAGGKKVRLEYRAPDAKSVCVAGTFNNWQRDATPMRAEAGGVWSIELELAPGIYEYRFVVDGCWCDDPNAAETTPNLFGGCNTVLRVSAAT